MFLASARNSYPPKFVFHRHKLFFHETRLLRINLVPQYLNLSHQIQLWAFICITKNPLKMSSQFFFAPWHIECETATSANANIIPSMPCCSHCTGWVTPQWAGCEASESRCIRATCLPWLLHWACSLKPFCSLTCIQSPLWIICVLLNSWLWIVNFDQRPVHFPLPVRLSESSLGQ